MLKIGAFAAQAGVTVRTLHYYEEIGLLTADRRSEAGHRLYGTMAALRLQQIQSLTALGFSLAEVAACLAAPHYQPLTVVEQHLDALRQEIDQKQALATRLASLAAALRGASNGATLSLTDLLEVNTMIEKYYTEAQQRRLAERARQVGPEAVAAAQLQWHALIEKVRVAMDAGIAPEAPEVRPLAEAWSQLIEAFTGGDAGIRASLGQLYAEEGPAPAQKQGFAMDAAMMAYMGQAVAALSRS